MLRHRTKWPSTKHWSTVSDWPKRSAFGGFYVMETPIWWCSTALAIGTQRMQTWQAIDSSCNTFVVYLRDVSSITFPELKMKERMHCPNWDPPGKTFQ